MLKRFGLTILLTSIAVVITISVIVLVNLNQQPSIQFGKLSPSSGNISDQYMECLTIQYESSSCDEIVMEHINEFGEKNSELLLLFVEKYTYPRHIEADLTFTDTQTIATYTGFATTQNGDIVDINEKITFDWVISTSYLQN